MRPCQTTQAELSLHDAFGRSDLCWHMGRSSQHTLMVAWPTRIILVVSYIGPYPGWVPPTVSHLLPELPPLIDERLTR